MIFNDARQIVLPVRDYDLAATLSSGQAFRWRLDDSGWTGVVAGSWVRLRQLPEGIAAKTSSDVTNWSWLRDYLQTDVDLASILATFPDDEPMRAAVQACRGVRLLRQDPWECLASFILSSTKQIVQIQQIVAMLCERFGQPLPVPAGAPPVFAFPLASDIADRSEGELRDCKMGFRAPYLLDAAKCIASGNLALESLRSMELTAARDLLTSLSGVGRKIADCVLLFAYGFPTAFPVDVWVVKGLQELYFPKRRARPDRLLRFSETHFGPNAGYAQQYLFHYMRTQRSPRGPTKIEPSANTFSS